MIEQFIFDVIKNNTTGIVSLILLAYLIFVTLRDISKQLKANWAIIDKIKEDVYKHETIITLHSDKIFTLDKEIERVRNKVDGA